MKLKDEIKWYRKEAVHGNYARIIKDFKEYDKISRTKMLDEVFEVYSDYKNIIDICNIKELEFLKKISKGKVKYQDIKDECMEEYYSLIGKFLINIVFNDLVTIPEEIEDVVKKAISNYDKKEVLKKDEINNILIGILKIYGAINKDDIVYLFMHYYTGLDEEYVLNHINNNKYFNYFVYDINDDVIAYENYYYFVDDIISGISKENIIRPLDEVIYLSHHRFDDRKESIKKFIDELNKYVFFHDQLFDEIERFVALDLDRKALHDELESVPVLKNKDMSHLIELMDDAMDDMPSCVLGGYTKKETAMIKESKKYNSRYKKNYNKIKDSDYIDQYRRLRQNVVSLMDDAMIYLVKSGHINKFNKTVRKNDILFSNDQNAITNFMIFHSIENEENVFSLYVKNNINPLSKDYELASKIEDSYVESLFEIKKLDSKSAKVYLKDVYTNNCYEITDVALSNGDLKNNKTYIYTSIVTINGYTFCLNYGFILIKENHEDILKEIKIKMKNIKVVKNDVTKRFIVCNNMFRKEKNLGFVQREL